MGSGNRMLGGQQGSLKPLRTPGNAVFDRKASLNKGVAPYKRLLRASVVFEEMLLLGNSANGDGEEEGGVEGKSLHCTHARLMGRLLGIAKQLHAKEGLGGGGKEGDEDDPSGLMNVLIELVGKMNATDLPEDLIFNVLVSSLYNIFYDTTKTMASKTAAVPSTEDDTAGGTGGDTAGEIGGALGALYTSDNRYTRFVVSVMRAMPLNTTRTKTQGRCTMDNDDRG